MSSHSKGAPIFEKPQVIDDLFMATHRRSKVIPQATSTALTDIQPKPILDLNSLLKIAPAPKTAPVVVSSPVEGEEDMLVDEGQTDKGLIAQGSGGPEPSSLTKMPPIGVLTRLLELDPPATKLPQPPRDTPSVTPISGTPANTDESDLDDLKVNDADLFVALGGWQSSITLVASLEKHLSSLRAALAAERQALQSLVYLQSQVYDQIGQLDGAIWARSIMRCDVEEVRGSRGKGKEKEV